MLEECFFTCPHCWQEVSILVDPIEEEQEYVEDCEVCCNPLRILVRNPEGAVPLVEVQPLQ